MNDFRGVQHSISPAHPQWQLTCSSGSPKYDTGICVVVTLVGRECKNCVPMHTMVEYFRENTAYWDVATFDADHNMFLCLCTGADSGLIWLKLHASRASGT